MPLPTDALAHHADLTHRTRTGNGSQMLSGLSQGQTSDRSNSNQGQGCTLVYKCLCPEVFLHWESPSERMVGLVLDSWSTEALVRAVVLEAAKGSSGALTVPKSRA